MLWKLNDELIFDCDARYYNYTIPSIYASPQLLAKYSTWKMLDGKTVVVCQQIGKPPLTFKVYLKGDGPLYTVIVDGKYLSAKPKAAPTGCTCSNQTLMIRGCACGHFSKEKSNAASLKTVPW
ncbi:hypothetical protein C4588_04790 [Candidatus Parcubacteria bacterium]|nr:MAG: hypothetical protein C4588_04790 [Candidatus Parcubacteria bacterium]